MVCKIVVCGKSHSLNEQGVLVSSVICVDFVSVHRTRRVVFPKPQLCFRHVMACACNIISTGKPEYSGLRVNSILVVVK